MSTSIHTPHPLPENLFDLSASRRSWSGATLEVIEFHGRGRVVHQFGHQTEDRLSVLLEEVGERCEPRLSANAPCPIGYMPRHMTYAPAGMEVWGYGGDVRYVKEAMLSFNFDELAERLQTSFSHAAGSAPRLRFVDDRIWTLVKLLADAVNDADPSMQLYGEGLVTGIAAQLLSRPQEVADEPRGLSPWQLRRVVEYLQTSLPDRVALSELAVLSGLSQWHFSRAFKASTGMAPYRWQLEARMRRAKSLLLDTRATLEQISEATGFADAVHFGRTFRRIVGTTPAAWRKAHRK